MAIPEMNGVGAAQSASEKFELKPQEEQKIGTIPVGQGYASGGEATQNGLYNLKSQGNQNSFLKSTTYSKEDFAQLKKYGDNIARDLNQANSRLGGQYAKLERDLVRAIRLIGNPDDPNYITAQSYLEDLHAITAKTKEEFNFPKGGKEANYKDAQASIEMYERDTRALLDGIKEDGTFVALMNATKDIKANDNRNAAMNAAVTVSTGEAVMANDNANAADINANVDREGAATRKAVHAEGASTRKTVRNEGAKTRRTVRAEGQATREAVHFEGAMTRNTVRAEGARTRNTVRREAANTRNTVRAEGTKTREAARQVGQETQEINELSNNVSDVLNAEYHTGETKKQVGDMRDKIVSSNLPHESKKEMLKDLANFSDQVVISDKEIADEQKDVDMRIAIEKDTQKPETPAFEAPPLREYPGYENPFPNMGGGTSSSKEPSTAPAKKPKQNPFIHNESKPIDRENKGVPASTKSDTPPAPQENRGVPYAPEPSKPDVLEPMFKKKHKN